MLAHRVVEHLDVIEYVLPGFLARFSYPTPNAFALCDEKKLSATALS
jgi:hypothetical protein